MRTRLLLVCALVVSVAMFCAASDSWPGFRGPTGDGRSHTKNLPTKWSEKENVAWKTEVHGKGWSSPVILGKQVWLTTADEVPDKDPVPKKGGPPANPVKEVSFFVVCIDRDTGKVIHDVKLGTEDKPGYCHPVNSYASSTPCIEEGRLYAHFGSNGTWCVDTATGKVLWERKDLKCDHFRGAASSPVVHGDLVYLIFDGFDVQYVAALDKLTGKTVWKVDRKIKYRTDSGDEKKAYATPAILEISGKSQLICPSAECTIAYEPKTGAELWRVSHGGMNSAARPVMADGLLFVTTGYPSKLLAVKPDAKPDETGMLPKESVVWRADKSVPSQPSVIVNGGLVFMVSDGGIVSCLEAMTGKLLWSERLDGEFSASPILANGNLYFCNRSGKTFVVPAEKTFSQPSENRLSGGFMASPAVSGEDLYLRTKTHLYRIGGKQ